MSDSNHSNDQRHLSLPTAERPRLAPTGDSNTTSPEEEMLWSLLKELTSPGALIPRDPEQPEAALSDPISVITLRDSIRTLFGVDLPLHQLTRASTFRQLAEHIRAARLMRHPPQQPDPAELQQLEKRQRSLVACLGTAPKSPTYSLTKAARIKGLLNLVGLEAAVRATISKHPELAQTFHDFPSDKCRRHVFSACIPELFLDELPIVHISERIAVVERYLTIEQQHPFDLERGPLVRSRLLRIGEDDALCILQVHALVADEAKLLQVWSEIWELYSQPRTRPSQEETLSSGHTPPLQATPEVSEKEFRVLEQAWLQKLAPYPLFLQLPTDKARTGLTESCAQLPLELPATLRNQSEQTSPPRFKSTAVTLLAALGAFFARYSQQEKFLIALQYTYDGDSLGCCPKTLDSIVPFDIDTSQPFEKVHAQTESELNLAFQFSKVPVGSVWERLSSVRSHERRISPQVRLLLTTTRSAPKHEGLVVVPAEIPQQYSSYELTLKVETNETGECLATFIFNTELFKKPTVERWAQGFQALLQSITGDPKRPVARLPIVGSRERQLLEAFWNNKATEFPETVCFHKLFEKQVERTPHAIAVRCNEGALTYRELDRRANKVARALVKRGIAVDSRVGICTARSLEMMVAVFATLKAGAAYVPLDPTYPPQRLKTMVTDSITNLLITQSAVDTPWLPAEVPKLCLDTDWETIDATEGATPPEVNVGPENLMYVIYTSGSTGVPKGVAIKHQGVVSFMLSLRQMLDFGSAERLLALAALSFDMSVTELLLPLTTGAEVIIGTRDLAADGEALRDYLERNRVSFLQATPVTWSLLLSAGWRGDSDLVALSGGESLTRQLAHEILAKVKTLWNLYGPTETTACCTGERVQQESGPMYVGRPISNMKVYVLDVLGEPLPIGFPGEIYIGGVGLAREYLNRPELNSEKFIEPISHTIPSPRLYRTGDVGRIHADGRIEILGRIDRQVKIRGYRIELGEIEDALQKHPAIQHVAVTTHQDKNGLLSLVAYFVPRPATPVIDTKDLRSHLANLVPKFMFPRFFLEVEALPVTSNGKINYRALPPPPIEGQENAATVMRGKSLEETLVLVFQETLSLDHVGLHDNFFELGGDSLMTLRIVSGAAKRGVQLNSHELFNSPTIAELATTHRLTSAGLPLHFKGAVKLNTCAVAPALFLVPPHGGGPHRYVEFTKHFNNIAIYSLQNRYAYGTSGMYGSIEEMADEYLKSIKIAQPKGPYLVGGYSMGGVVAFELARKLLSQGDQVAGLVLLNSTPERSPSWWESFNPIPWCKSFYMLDRFRHLPSWLNRLRAKKLFRELATEAEVYRFFVLLWHFADDPAAYFQFAFPDRLKERELAEIKVLPRDQMLDVLYRSVHKETVGGEYAVLFPTGIELIVPGKSGASFAQMVHVMREELRNYLKYRPRDRLPITIDLFHLKDNQAAAWIPFSSQRIEAHEIESSPTSTVKDPHMAMMKEENLKRWIPVLKTRIAHILATSSQATDQPTVRRDNGH